MRLAAGFTVLPLVLLFPLFFFACVDSDFTATGPKSVTQPVGPEGGTILVRGATVTIPEGALGDTLQITITETAETPPAGFTAASSVFRCEPSGTDFAADVTMRIPFNDNGQPLKMFWSTASDPTFKDIGGSTTDGRTVTATVKSFSAGFVGRAN